ncbi:type-2 ice-structuring protein-like [Neolamprologus brichardi]|uniref:type-2 ice-structuring protein-like n=1 Tax=Neolamprologus brichardi TaxID=32507 RepID=UPI0016438360|nr:type-2 ice-structuring protein-like [Neolamprologus brichardi]
MTWAEAQRNCQNRGGQLASVYSASQANEIQKEVQHAGRGYGQFWVGGHNTPADPSWSWSDYMGVSAFAEFCRGEEAKHKHHCLQITFGEGKAGCLDDMKCVTKLPSICGSLIM